MDGHGGWVKQDERTRIIRLVIDLFTLGASVGSSLNGNPC
jgi:hypothetical protein